MLQPIDHTGTDARLVYKQRVRLYPVVFPCDPCRRFHRVQLGERQPRFLVGIAALPEGDDRFVIPEAGHVHAHDLFVMRVDFDFRFAGALHEGGGDKLRVR